MIFSITRCVSIVGFSLVSSFCLTGCLSANGSSPHGFSKESSGFRGTALSRNDESAPSSEPSGELLNVNNRPEQSPVAQAISPFEQFVINETNLVRTQPQAYIQKLQLWRNRFQADGRSVMKDGGVLLRTREGVAAVDEAIQFLTVAKPVEPLTFSPGLSVAAQDHVAAQGATGATGHTGAAGDMKERVERHGVWAIGLAENIHYGADTPADVVMKLIIDDGVASRGHRKNLFNPALKVGGIASGFHSAYKSMCVIIYAGGFTNGK